MSFDIFNSETRKVICTDNDPRGMFPGSEIAALLTVGKVYTVVDVEVHSWHTLVTLKEFPGRQFNSAHFEEIDAKPDKTMKYFTKHFVTNGDDFLVLEPDDWTKEQWQAFLAIFGLKEAERIVINEYKMEAFGIEKE